MKDDVIQFDSIVIPKKFKNSKPRDEKLQVCRENLEEGFWDRELVVNGDNILVDGYILYLCLQEQGFYGDTVVKRKLRPLHTYVYGRHPGHNKEYVWKVPEYLQQTFDKKIGDPATVRTKRGVAPIIITNIVTRKDMLNGDIKLLVC